MASDIFAKLGDIKGESQDDKHKDEIEVLSFSWGVSNAGSAARGGGMGTGKADFQDLIFTKHVDKSSPKLVLNCAKGEHMPTATVVMRKAGGEQKEYLKITLNDVMISGFQTSGADGGEVLTESITLNFGKISVEYFEQDNKGTMTSAGKATYDLKANKASS